METENRVYNLDPAEDEGNSLPFYSTWLYRYKKSTAQLLIRWCLQRGYVCIPKSVKENRIIENGDIFDFMISDEDMQVLVCQCTKLYTI